ncbi:MAG TPA: hypothetical protein VN132_07365, partial [Bdellovibrio sp.]|nr:hypothetical protein [Bdellovibrio sp.]
MSKLLFSFLAMTFMSATSMADSYEDRFNELKAQNARVTSECINLDKMKKKDSELAAKLYKNLRRDNFNGRTNVESQKEVPTNLRGVGIERDKALFIFGARQIGFKYDSGVASRSEARHILQSKIEQLPSAFPEMTRKQIIVRFDDECRIPDRCEDNYPPTTLKE